MEMRYDIEADFYLLSTCNFRCKYCFVNPAALAAKIRVHATNEQWEQAYNATGKTWLIHFTGGEPMIYPGIVDLCHRLSQRHYLSINSNLAHASVENFANTIDAARVHFINAAVHFDERDRRGGVEVFIQRALKLRDAGFAVLPSLVMTPDVIDRFDDIAATFESRGLTLISKTLRGPFDGITYPRGYLPHHRDIIRRHAAHARERYAGLIQQMGEAPTIDMFTDDRNVDGLGQFRGRLCGSGHNFVAIAPDGTAVRCGSKRQLGNILHNTLRLLPGPVVCDTGYCPYWCRKYTSERFVGTHRSSGTPLAVLDAPSPDSSPMSTTF